MPSADDDVPPSFICSLTLEIMTDPATAADGHSYEYEAISKWLEHSQLSPLTGQRLEHKKLTRSHALRNAIEEFQQARQRVQRRSAPGPSGGSKVILLGDSNVGKTSLVRRIKEGTFSTSSAAPTIGCSFCTHNVCDGRAALAIWDTAGAEKYRSFTRQYFRGAAAVVLLYDITAASSLEGLPRWLSDVEAELQTSSTVLVIAASKADRAEERQADEGVAQALAAQYGAAYFECSAKTGTNCDAIFEWVGEQVAARAQPVYGAGPSRGAEAAVRIEVERRLNAGRCCT
jgi:small GTP-binding protein